jgi:hypothetical protein
MSSSTTIAIDKETHKLIRQYCIINSLNTKDFVRIVTNDKLRGFKQVMKDMRKMKI